MKLKKKNKQVYNLTRGPDNRLGVVGWAFSKRSAECIKKIKTKKKSLCCSVDISKRVRGITTLLQSRSGDSKSDHCQQPESAQMYPFQSRGRSACFQISLSADSFIIK